MPRIESSKIIRLASGLKWHTTKKLAWFDFRSGDGKRHREPEVTCESAKDAKEKFAAYKAGFRQNSSDAVVHTASSESKLSLSMPTFREYVDAFRDSSIGRKWAASTRKVNKEGFERWILPFLGDIPLNQIGPAKIDGLIEHLKQPEFYANGSVKRKVLSPSTINFVLRLVRCTLRNAFEPPAREEREPLLVRVPKFEKSDVMQDEVPLELEMSREEEAQFLAAFEDWERFKAHAQRNPRGRVTAKRAAVLFSWFRASKPMFVLALETGLRWESDLLTLKWENVNLAEEVVRGRQQKTGEPFNIPLTERGVAAMKELMKRRVVGSPWVFTTTATSLRGNDKARKFAESTFRRYYTLAKEFAGITRRVRPHDLRHTAGSALVSAGVDLYTAGAILGQKDARTTKRYARHDLKALREAMAKRNSRSSD